MEILNLRTKSIEDMAQLVNQLHYFFSEQIHNLGHNPYGIAFPKIKNGSIGDLVSVYCPQEGGFTILSHPLIVKSIANNRISIIGSQNISEILSNKNMAFIRDRKRERRSPRQVLKHLSNGSIPKDQAKEKIAQYFQENPVQIKVTSHSNKHVFTLNIASQQHFSPTIPESNEPLKFNSYGLSSHKNPVYLPVLEV